MAVRLPPEEVEFLKRVRDYCAAGLTQPAMAHAEEMGLTAFRLRLYRAGFSVEAEVTRNVVRTGSGELLGDLLESGLIVVHETEAELAEAVA